MAKTLIAQIAARAKQIRSANPRLSWQSALKKAGAEFKGKKTTSKRTPAKKTPVRKSRKIGSALIPEHKPYFKKLTKAAAKKRYYDENKEVFGLRKDGSESLIVRVKDFENPEFYAFGSEIGSIGKKPKTTKKRATGSHKDTKSHNVNIRVVSGVKKTVRPKIKNSDIDLNKLNGILKIQTGKYFEVATGANKGSVFYIQSTRKATKETKKAYNVKFWEYRSGKLCKPFLAVISDAWINKRSIRPRGSVRSMETIGFAQ